MGVTAWRAHLLYEWPAPDFDIRADLFFRDAGDDGSLRAVAPASRTRTSPPRRRLGNWQVASVTWRPLRVARGECID